MMDATGTSAELYTCPQCGWTAETTPAQRNAHRDWHVGHASSNQGVDPLNPHGDPPEANPFHPDHVDATRKRVADCPHENANLILKDQYTVQCRACGFRWVCA